MRTPPAELDALLLQTAGPSGVALVGDLLRAGMSRAQLRTAVRTGRWTRVGRGVYGLSPTDQSEAWLRRVAALQLRSAADAVAYGRTAALVHRLPVLGAHPTRPQLTVVDDDRHLSRTTLLREDVAEVSGVRVTTLVRTAVDVCRDSSLLQGVMVLDAVLHRGVRHDDVRAAADRVATSRGRQRVVGALALARVGAQSPLETLGRVRLVERGVPEPDLQVELHDRRGLIGYVDHLWRDERVIGEADGMAKYAKRREEVPGSDPLEEEKRRELRLRDQGFEVVRYDWDEAWNRPDDLAGKVWSALDRARRQRRRA